MCTHSSVFFSQFSWFHAENKVYMFFFSGLSDFAPYFHDNGNMALFSISEDTPVGEGHMYSSYTLMDTHSVLQG